MATEGLVQHLPYAMARSLVNSVRVAARTAFRPLWRMVSPPRPASNAEGS
jgi:hypothetical protein